MATFISGPGTPIRAKLEAREKARLSQAGVSTPGNPRGPAPTPTPETPAPAATRERIKPRDYSGILRAEFGQDSVTSGYRSQAEQDALVRRGATKATRSSHTYSNGFDLAINSAESADDIRKRLRARGINVTKVIQESGKGKNQGTGPHWHIEIDGPSGGNQMAGRGNVPQINVAPSSVPGPSGRPNTGVTNQSDRIMNSGPTIENQQRQLESKAGVATTMLDGYMQVLQQTQASQLAETQTFTDAARVVNDDMMAATKDMQARVKPIFETRQRVLDQLTAIQDMDPISRAVRGFFDLNYDQNYLMSTSAKLGAIVKEQADMYSVMQGLHGDSLEALDRLHNINSMLPKLQEEQAAEMVKGSMMQVQRAMENLGITMEGVQNQSQLIGAQKLARQDLIGRLDGPTVTALVAQAEQNGGNVSYNGVQFSGQELRERGQQIEEYDISNRNARRADAAGDAELADRNASRMMRYMTDSQIDEAIASGGEYDGVQIPINDLTIEKANRTKAAIESVQVEGAMSNPQQAASSAVDALNFGRQMSARGASIFGNGAFDQETRQFNLKLADLSNRMTAEINGTNNPARLGALAAEMANLKKGYGDAISAKVNRLVGGDQTGAGYVTSYLLGDQVSPGAAADMMVHFATKGGLPAAMQTSHFGREGMKVVMQTVDSLTLTGVNGKKLTPAQVKAEAARRLANPNSAEGKQLRAATAGLKFQTTFTNLPELATRDGTPVHQFGKFDRDTFARLSRDADMAGTSEIASRLGVDAADFQKVRGGQVPEGMSKEMVAQIQSAETSKAVGAAQQRYLVDFLDQETPISSTMSNSELMLDFLQSPAGQSRLMEADDRSRAGGIGDWMAGSVTRGGLLDSMSNYTSGFAQAVGYGTAQSKVESAMIARTYRNDVPKRTLAILSSMPTLTRAEATQLSSAVARMLPTGTAEEQAAQNLRAPMRSELGQKTSLTYQQLDAASNIVLNHKFEDPALERIRRKAATTWVEANRAADSWADTLWNFTR